MTFERVVCWDPKRVPRVMEIEAEVAHPSIFTAVHTDEPLTFTRPQGERSAQQFLDEFLGRDGDVRAVVIGDSGSGKSHLVQWVKLNSPANSELRIVSIPRSGTSLRWVVQRLIGELPTDLRESFQEKLVDVPDTRATFKELELQLLAYVALALERSEPENEVDRALADGLRDFLLDPALRDRHAGDSGIVADLVEHITRASGREDRVTRRRFGEPDLHLDYAMTRMGDLSKPTRSILRSLQGNQEHKERAIELVNSCLDEAVTRTLGITGTELTELLNEIRRHMRRRGHKLILLIEDLARTEGIDRALLNALFERAGDLCDLRLLMAVTTGYYEREIQDTQKTRMDFIINLDKRQPLDEKDRIAPFAARYLNALRLDESDLDRWYEDNRGEGVKIPLLNACSECGYRPACHAAFGARSIDGAGEVGLYPFTQQALSNMARRSRDRSLEDGRLGPRELLRDFLRPVMTDLRAQSLSDGDFPDRSLLDSHDGPKLRLDVQKQIRDQTGSQAERYLALIELWSAAPGEVTQLPNDLYGAFGLSPLALGDPPAKTPYEDEDQEHDIDGPPAPETELLGRVLQLVDAIEHWANSREMTRVTNRLRDLVFRSVVGVIDWDGEGLEKSVFAGSRGTRRDSFQQIGIDFLGQDTNSFNLVVSLRLPLQDDDESHLQTALALQGLAIFDHLGHWDFENGLDLYLAVSRELPRWASHVVTQLRRVHDPKEEWDPVASAVEVLCVGAALASRPSQLDAPLSHRLGAILEKGDKWPEPDELGVRSEKWRALYRQIHRHQDELRELVLAHGSAMKGGRSGPMLDATRILEPLRALRRDWQPSCAPPERLNGNLPNRYQRLLDLHARVRADLDGAVEEERTRKLNWLDAIREHMPDGITRKDVVHSVERLIVAIDHQGIAVRTDRISAALEEFKAIQLDDAIRVASELRETSGPSRMQLPRLASQRRADAMHISERFMMLLGEFLNEVGVRVQSEKESIAGAEETDQQFARIGNALSDMQNTLELVTRR